MQAPLYLGLILAQGVYVYHFFIELWHLLVRVPTLDGSAELTLPPNINTAKALRLKGNGR